MTTLDTNGSVCQNNGRQEDIMFRPENPPVMGSGRVGQISSILFIAAILTTVIGPSVHAAPVGLAAVAEQADPDETLVTVTIHPDGDATWQVRYVFQLADENATQAFETFEDDIEAEPGTYRQRFAERINETVRSAERVTGREMAARDFAVDATVDPFARDWGFVTYTFVWTDFAVVNGTHIRAGDAVAGLFLDENTTLTVAWPTGYQPTSVRPEPADQRPTEVTWTGRRNFGPGTPHLVVVDRTVTTPTNPQPTTVAPNRGGDQARLLPIGIAVVVVIAAGVSAWVWKTGRTVADLDASRDEPPSELLSNEEQVLNLLEDHGGRIKQQDLADELGWSDMKTSNVVRDMRDAGTIDGFRLGRENVLTLPDGDDI